MQNTFHASFLIYKSKVVIYKFRIVEFQEM